MRASQIDAIGDGDVLERVEQCHRRDLAALGRVGQRFEDRARIRDDHGIAGGSRRRAGKCQPDDVLHVPRVFEERAHESVRREQVGFIDESHLASDVRLELRDQPVGAPAGQQLDGAAGADQELRRRRRPPRARARGRGRRLSRSVPNAAASQPSDATSRSPPLPSFRSGSNRWAVEPNARRRASAAIAQPARERRRGRRVLAPEPARARDPPASRRPRRDARRASPSTRRTAPRRCLDTPPACGPRARRRARVPQGVQQRVGAGDRADRCVVAWTTSRSTSDAGSWTIRPYPPIARSRHARRARPRVRTAPRGRHHQVRAPARHSGPWCPGA